MILVKGGPGSGEVARAACKVKKQFNVLLADDDHGVCFVISTVLQRFGHTVEIAPNGKEAIHLFTVKPGHFDVVISDDKLPIVSSLQLVEHLRRSAFAGKIIVISGALTSELQTAYHNKQVDKILQKPFTVEGLSFTLDDLFRQWEASLSRV